MVAVVGTQLIGVDVTRTDTVQAYPLGTKVDCDDGTTRVYIRAGATIAVNSALMPDFAEGPYDWQPTTGVDVPIYGVAAVAIADNAFGWVIVEGIAFVLVAAAPGAANSQLTPSAVAGTLDDIAAAAGNALAQGAGRGCVLIADDTPSAGIGKVMLT